MPLPPKGDPRRPLHLAVRSARVLGVAMVVLGLCGTLPMLLGIGGVGAATTLFMVGSSLFYFGPGIGYLVLASYLSDYRRWAVTALLVIVSLQTLLALAGTVVAVFLVMNEADQRDAFLAIPAAIVVLLFLALGQMIVHLVKSYDSVNHPPYGREGLYQGFSPVFPAVSPARFADPTTPPPPGVTRDGP
jgi:hypothetical protein